MASRASAANEDDRVIHQFHCNRSGSSLASNVSAASIGTVKLNLTPRFTLYRQMSASSNSPEIGFQVPASRYQVPDPKSQDPDTNPRTQVPVASSHPQVPRPRSQVPSPDPQSHVPDPMTWTPRSQVPHPGPQGHLQFKNRQVILVISCSNMIGVLCDATPSPKLAACAQIGNIVFQLLAHPNRLLHELRYSRNEAVPH